MARSDESNTRDRISQMLSFKLKDIISEEAQTMFGDFVESEENIEIQTREFFLLLEMIEKYGKVILNKLSEARELLEIIEKYI
jgi:hypothetical protein